MEIVKLIIGLILVGLYFMVVFKYAWSSKIRNSKFWYFGWLGSLIILAIGGSLIIQFFYFIKDFFCILAV